MPLVQSKVVAGGTSLPSTGTTVSFDNPVTGGNAVIVAVAMSQETTVAASDATNGAYTSTVAFAPVGESKTAAILSKRNVTGGFTNVTVTPGVTGTGAIVIFEVSGADNAVAPQTGTKFNDTVTAMVSSAAGALTDTGAFTVTAGQSGSNNNWTPGTGYTADTSTTGNSRVIQHRLGAVSDAGPWTESATDQAACAMAVFTNASVGASPLPFITVLEGRRL